MPVTPLKLSGAISGYESRDITPVIGTEFPSIDLSQWLTAPNSDDLLRDLAITVCERGVVAIRGQTNLTNEQQKELTQRMGLLSGKPANHGLSKHPLHIIRKDDPEVSLLDPARQAATHGGDSSEKPQKASAGWHTDTSYEACPADFSALRMTDVPPVGGDTLYASCYELYDRLSPPYQKFFEGLTATHEIPQFRAAYEAGVKDLYYGPRGAPENDDTKFRQVHPVVRTHPVTGWKSLFAGGIHCRRINEVTELESKDLLDNKILRLVADNHDLQARIRWEGSGDLVIWDNRCVLHCPTQDHFGLGAKRFGYRTLSIAERPFFDPTSVSRWEDVENNKNKNKA